MNFTHCILVALGHRHLCGIGEGLSLVLSRRQAAVRLLLLLLFKREVHLL